jgi:hypothetical protein
MVAIALIVWTPDSKTERRLTIMTKTRIALRAAGRYMNGAANTQKRTYSVVVRDPNSWDSKTDIHRLLRSCGHNHKTFRAAKACENALLDYHCNHGRPTGTMCYQCHGIATADSWSADWHLSSIEDSDGNHVEVNE